MREYRERVENRKKNWKNWKNYKTGGVPSKYKKFHDHSVTERTANVLKIVTISTH